MNKKLKVGFNDLSGTHLVANDPGVVRVAHDANVKDIVESVENDKHRAVVITPQDRQRYINLINGLTFSQRQKLRETLEDCLCKNGQLYHSDGSALQGFGNAEIPPFITDTLLKIVDITSHQKGYTANEGAIFLVFHTDKNSEDNIPVFHTDDDLTVHVSLWGAPLEFSAAVKGISVQDHLKMLEASNDNLIPHANDNASEQDQPGTGMKGARNTMPGQITSVKIGDITVFNKNFIHRSPLKAKQCGHLALACIKL